MSDVRPFDPSVKQRRKSIPHPGGQPAKPITKATGGDEAREALFKVLDELKSLVEAGTITIVALAMAGPEGCRHLVWDSANADVSDAAQVHLALRVASDQIVSQIMTDAGGTCDGCGGPLHE